VTVGEIVYASSQIAGRRPSLRALKRYRTDKRPEDADSMESLRWIHVAQLAGRRPVRSFDGSGAAS